MSIQTPMKLVLASWLLAMPAFSQSAWGDFLEKRSNRFRESAPLTLLFPARDLKDAELLITGEGDIQEMLLGHDLALEGVPSAAAKARWGPNRFDFPWVLLDAKGEECSETGLGLGSLLKQLRKDRGTLSWEARKAFLVQHPENGEAWQAEVAYALRGAERELQRRAAKAPLRAGGSRIEDQEARADELFRPLMEALQGFAKVPQWWCSSEWMGWLPALERDDAALSPKLRAVLRDMHRELLDAWRRAPHSGSARLGMAWIRMGGMLQEWDPPLRLPRLTPLPGRVWPSPDVLLEFTTSRCALRKWDDLLAQLDELPLPEPFRPGSEEDWIEYCTLRAGRGFVKAIATAGLGHWEQCLEALDEAREWAGPGWEESESRERYLKLLSAAAPALRRERAADLHRVLEAPVVPRPMPPPRPEVLRLVLCGKPTWQSQWEGLRQAPGLASWDASELVWGVATTLDPELVERMAWSQAPRWLLYQGKNVVASDTALPDEKHLRMLLAETAPSKLQSLDHLLLREPDHLDAHQTRFQMLLPRMPHPALEAELAESARQARIPVDFGYEAAWKPSSLLWGSQASRLMPELMDQLKAWPSSADTWSLYRCWLRFQPSMPPLISVAQGLVSWESRSRWAAGLAPGVHEFLREDFRNYKRFDLMREWFLLALKGLPAGMEASDPSGQDRAAAIVSGLREALTTLHHDDELKELAELP